MDGRVVEDPPPDGEEELEGIALSVETPLKTLRALCDKLGLSRSGGKNKVRKGVQRESSTCIIPTSHGDVVGFHEI